MNKPKLPGTINITRDLQDGEVMLVFEDLEHANLFYTWWDEVGGRAFSAWYDYNENDEPCPECTHRLGDHSQEACSITGCQCSSPVKDLYTYAAKTKSPAWRRAYRK